MNNSDQDLNIERFQVTETGFVLTNTDIIILILIILVIYFWPSAKTATTAK